MIAAAGGIIISCKLKNIYNNVFSIRKLLEQIIYVWKERYSVVFLIFNYNGAAAGGYHLISTYNDAAAGGYHLIRLQ